MTDSRAKGQRAEYAIRDMLREATGVQWERVPGSGGFGAQHGLKGDIYLPDTTGFVTRYCIEVKHYKDDSISSNLMNPSKSNLEKWWEQTVREAGQVNKVPVLVFKKDRGKWLVAVTEGYPNLVPSMQIVTTHASINIYKFEDWLELRKDELTVKF